MKSAYAELEKSIGISFNNKELLVQALSHSSYTNEKRLSPLNNNERLEFLGDAVLEVISSKLLYFKFKNKAEGELSKMRASLVCEPALAVSARKIQLEKYILLGKGEEKTGGRNRDSIISDCLEALIGAIYLDLGIEKAEEFIKKFVLNDIGNIQVFSDYKTKLQEVLQARGTNAVYTLVKESGPSHQKTFEIEVSDGENVLGYGKGHSKKNAEQNAAKEALENLQKE